MAMFIVRRERVMICKQDRGASAFVVSQIARRGGRNLGHPSIQTGLVDYWHRTPGRAISGVTNKPPLSLNWNLRSGNADSSTENVE